jgi:tetratricopeptide (TPR) repeat protein
MARFYSTPQLRNSDVKTPLRRTLSALPDDYHVCLEFRTGKAGKDYDILLAHRNGLYIVEVKNENRVIEGGLSIPHWPIRDAKGDPVATLDNPYNQVINAATNLRDHLRRNSRDILVTDCKPQRCSAQLCTYHSKFWSGFAIFPYLCIPNWNPKNNISPDVWCHLVQGNTARTAPPFILQELPKRTWSGNPKTSYLSMSDDQIARLIKTLGCVPISLGTALGQPAIWLPKIDSQVIRSSREAELKDLESQLNRDKVVAVVGEPKGGKSTLCQLLAADLDRQGLPVWDYDFRLAEHAGRFAAVELLGAVLSQLQVPQRQTLQDDIAAIIGVLISKPGLLIIDNFEASLDNGQIIGDAALSQFVEQLLSMREQLASFVLITTTSAFRTHNRLRPPHYAIPRINHAFALNFLTSDSRGWTTDQADRIYNIRPGNPHAIRLASSEIRSALTHGFSFDEAYDHLAPEIVAQTYGLSYNRFTPTERLLAEILALHPSGMSLDVVEFILRRLDFHGNVMQLLVQLYNREAITSTGTRWFSILPQDRGYIYQRTEMPHNLHRIAMDYYLSLVKLGDSQTEIPEEQALTVGFYHALEADQVQSAFDIFTALRHRPTVFGFPSALSSMGRQLGEHPRFQNLSAQHRGHVLQFNGRLLRHLGDIEAARSKLQLALQMFEKADDPIASASVLSDLGLVVRKQGEYAEELELYDRALDTLGDCVSADALRARSSILGRKGQALQMKGTEPQVVFECYNEAVRLARKIDDRQLLVTRLGMLGTAYRELGKRDMTSAIKCFSEAIQVSEATVGTPDLEGVTAGLAKTYEKARQLPQALELYLKAYELTKDTDLFGLLDRLGTLGHVYYSLGKFDESETYYIRALDLATRLGNRKAEAENLDAFGSVHRTRALSTSDPTRKDHLLTEALHCHRKAVEIQDTLQGDPSGKANRYQELGRTLLALKALIDARAYFIKAAGFARQAHKSHLEAWQFLRLGDVLDELNQKEDSFLCYAHAINLSPKEMAHIKKTADKAFRALSPDSQKNVMARLSRLDVEIQRILEAKYGE